jgi:hypothetical protein
MDFFPILSAPYCKGLTTLFNFSPNNWEGLFNQTQYMHVTFLENGLWNSVYLGKLKYKESKSFQLKDFDFISNIDGLVLLSLSENLLDKTSSELPNLVQSEVFRNPTWRASLTLVSEFTETSYQGEMVVFPIKASLLTFSPFFQLGNSISNYVLLLNIEKSPNLREAKIEIFNAETKKLLKSQLVSNNRINIISLDDLGIDEKDLLVVICREMAFIPLYYSCTNRGEFMSLEHSHPPSKFVVHGERFKAQGFLKKTWLTKLR